MGSLTSSYCRDGCRFDRHSHGAPKFLRTIGDEGVIFEDHGPGAVTRIWMTMGNGISTPLDPSIGIRIHIDDTLVVDMPLPAFFSGTQAPFLAPANGSRDVSSGGNYCLTPMPYRKYCRISLTNARDKRFWFQINHQRFSGASRITPFDGSDRFHTWRQHLSQPGQDPWQDLSRPLQNGQVVIQPGGGTSILDLTGSDTLYGLTLQMPASAWTALQVTITMDGLPRIDMPIADFFAIGSPGQTPAQSLFLGYNGASLYCYFPMPFFQSAKITISDANHQLGNGVLLAYQLRSAGFQAPSNAGYFTAISSQAEVAVGDSHQLFDLTGRGKWVGMFAELGGVGTDSLNYLEGDEQVFLDGAEHPQLYGTGVEDFFGGGFYFRDEKGQPQPFQLALHGMSGHDAQNGEGTTAMYRFMVGDAVPFNQSARAVLEAGPTSNIAMRAKTVNYFYLREPRPAAISDADTVELADSASPIAGKTIAKAGGIPFQDAALEAFLRTAFWIDSDSGLPIPFDADADGAISFAEAQAVDGAVDIWGENIQVLTDLQHFPNIASLRIANTGASTLDLAQFADMFLLVIDQNPSLASLQLTGLPSLVKLEVLGNAALTQVTTSDVDALEILSSDFNPSLSGSFFQDLTQLHELHLSGCPIASLDLQDLPNLVALHLQKMPVLNGLDASNHLALEQLTILGSNALQTLLLTNSPALQSLILEDNPHMSSLMLQDLPQLRHVTAIRNANLHELELTNLTSLRTVTASQNALSSVQIGQCPNLEVLQAADNRLNALDFVNGLASLEWLDASGNRLLTLPALPSAVTSLHLKHNRMLDLGQGPLPTSLVFLDAANNHLLDAGNLTAVPDFLTQPFAYLGLGDNFLNGDDCSIIEALALRSQQSSALFEFQPQHLPYPAWPDANVAVLIQNGFAPFNCSLSKRGHPSTHHSAITD